MELFNILIRKNFSTCKTLCKAVPNNLKGKKADSKKWLIRYIRDPYVEKARQENYRCRSAFKLLEINGRFNILTPGLCVVDCGAAPGSWTQVAVNLTNASGKIENTPVGSVYAIDRLPIHHIDGATIFGNLDFTSNLAQTKLRGLLKQPVDVVMSDMAPNATGIRDIDHDQIIVLAYAAMEFAVKMSKVDGTFVVKIWDGGKSSQFERDVARFYNQVKIVRPDATRDESTEKYVLARGFKGLKIS
ncbi:rRNA methyltransferase 2, mitochondrial [Microplitis demolitor]|uniref:rRNA methyltransferase 2, mitochondrial n=1 Tax=Microplitis demolitor TaxID=69319 RepID=UPI0004CD5FF8|nr:rRNA methyltransferase 2, mitochondrial [Microplitis demolitor]XP_053593234.1 rRNA methyltransferase 2, mitochondrial [Microplitis demolitor]XP_053593235.1 rRNA methyltransferase 2, mitochondrial [Microplitis demolitor]